MSHKESLIFHVCAKHLPGEVGGLLLQKFQIFGFSELPIPTEWPFYIKPKYALVFNESIIPNVYTQPLRRNWPPFITVGISKFLSF